MYQIRSLPKTHQSEIAGLSVTLRSENIWKKSRGGRVPAPVGEPLNTTDGLTRAKPAIRSMMRAL